MYILEYTSTTTSQRVKKVWMKSRVKGFDVDKIAAS